VKTFANENKTIPLNKQKTESQFYSENGKKTKIPKLKHRNESYEKGKKYEAGTQHGARSSKLNFCH
jgi:hypothetical protein